MAVPKDTRLQPNRGKSSGVNNAKEAAGHLKDGISIDNSVRAGKTDSVRKPRDIEGQNRTGNGKPW